MFICCAQTERSSSSNLWLWTETDVITRPTSSFWLIVKSVWRFWERRKFPSRHVKDHFYRKLKTWWTPLNWFTVFTHAFKRAESVLGEKRNHSEQNCLQNSGCVLMQHWWMWICPLPVFFFFFITADDLRPLSIIIPARHVIQCRDTGSSHCSSFSKRGRHEQMIAQSPVRSSSRRAVFCARLIWAGIVFVRGLPLDQRSRWKGRGDTAGDNLEAA